MCKESAVSWQRSCPGVCAEELRNAAKYQDGVPAENGTKHLLITSPERYRCSSLFGGVLRRGCGENQTVVSLQAHSSFTLRHGIGS
jgi:hypothetical protein